MKSCVINRVSVIFTYLKCNVVVKHVNDECVCIYK